MNNNSEIPTINFGVIVHENTVEMSKNQHRSLLERALQIRINDNGLEPVEVLREKLLRLSSVHTSNLKQTIEELALIGVYFEMYHLATNE